MLDMITLLMKYAALLIGMYIVYLVYYLVIEPWSVRQRYKKYNNVDVSETYYPVVGDLKSMNDHNNRGDATFQDTIDCARHKPEKDMKLIQVLFTLFLIYKLIFACSSDH